MTMLERVARALAHSWAFSIYHAQGERPCLMWELHGYESADQAVERLWRTMERDARAAIEAMREPTEAMWGAGERAQEEDWINGDALGWAQIPVTYTAMIDAALTEGGE